MGNELAKLQPSDGSLVSHYMARRPQNQEPYLLSLQPTTKTELPKWLSFLKAKQDSSPTSVNTGTTTWTYASRILQGGYNYQTFQSSSSRSSTNATNSIQRQTTRGAQNTRLESQLQQPQLSTAQRAPKNQSRVAENYRISITAHLEKSAPGPSHARAVSQDLVKKKSPDSKRRSAILKSISHINCHDAIPFLQSLLNISPETLKKYLSVAQRLTTVSSDYAPILEYINNGQAHKSFGLEVIEIIRISLHHAAKDFTRSQSRWFDRHNSRMMLWHGTNESNIFPILRTGLTVPKTKSSARLLLGRGIYFADRISKSATYCHSDQSPRKGKSGCVLLCDVALGTVYPCRDPMYMADVAPPGYDSAKAIGRYCPRGSDNSSGKKFHGSYMPSGNTVANADRKMSMSYSVNYNEYAVYNADQIIVKYLVYFRFTEKPFRNT